MVNYDQETFLQLFPKSEFVWNTLQKARFSAQIQLTSIFVPKFIDRPCLVHLKWMNFFGYALCQYCSSASKCPHM